ncbi:MAG: tyrosine-type recombinase/integrase [Oscillospiraceae bacterium]|nr:tyrosine-type recombinase/integrase [Oscillospiraceae bacterium]
MKLPNGYGSIVKLTGKRRKPYLVRTACKYSDDGEKMIEKRQILGYYATKSEALAALADYNADPYDLAAHGLVLSEVIEKCFAECKLAENTKKSYVNALNKVSRYNDMQFSALKLTHWQSVIDELKPSMQSTLKNSLRFLYTYAIRHEITDKDYSSMIEVQTYSTKKKKSVFTSAEINKLWEMQDQDDFVVRTLLILLYTGWRIEELLQMQQSDIDLTAGIMTGGIKTEAGKNRVVPIHHRILPLIQASMNGEKYLISKNGKKYTYAMWKYYFDEFQAVVGFSHTTHETRHTFVSLLTEKNAKKICVKKLVGHSGDVTDNIYTHISIDELRETIELLD